MGTVENMYLIRLARDRSETGRKAFADALSDLFVNDGGRLGQHERELMYDILHRVVRDIERSMRVEVSRQLAGISDLPRGLAVVLANDEIEVAYPILALSTVLLDEDLIEVVRDRTVEHQTAVACRESLSETVSEALVATGNEEVITTLLRNPNARITSATMEYLVEESQRVNVFQEPILRRADLDPHLAERMIMWVSAALRQYILDNFEVDEDVVDDALESTALNIVLSGPSQATPKKARVLAEVMEQGGMVTPDWLVAVLRDGEMRLFVAMFERLTRLQESIVMDIILEPGGEGLAIACRACGIGKAYFAALYALIRRTRGITEKQFRREVRGALGLYDRVSEGAAKDVVRRWRRNIGYLAAIRELKLG